MTCNDVAMDEVHGQIDLYASSIADCVPMCREVFVVSFGKILLSRIFYENSPKKAFKPGLF